MIPSGRLDEWPKAAAAWDARVSDVRADVAEELGLPANMSEATPANATELRIPDWPAVPARIRACLGRKVADRLLDARDPVRGDIGRVALQEEYAEWRLVHGERGPVRFELTTELSDYWELLARHAPGTAVALASEFARTPVDPSALFGDHDPFADSSTDEARAESFLAQMIVRRGGDACAPPPSPLNNGLKAITCLSRPDNTLYALLKLVTAAAAAPQLVIDDESGAARFPSGSEALPALPEGTAQDCRHSDPLIVERIVRIATEGRLVRLNDPVGVYVVDVQMADLIGPDSEPLPAGWCRLSRDASGVPDDLPRPQRVEIEAPPEASFELGDVRSSRTGEQITHGAQIAELVQLAVYVRTGPPDPNRVTVTPRPPSAWAPCGERPACAQVRELARRLDAVAS